MFAPGDEVVFVDISGKRGGHGDEVLPTIGAHYTVREVAKLPGFEHAITLVEIVNPPHDYTGIGFCEAPFASRRFRPVKRETISVFREMCTAISSGRTLVKVD